ncbi:NAD(P)/FAD-dependent oxidoreductase [Catenulispora pinisilvae]|uniref:NAD(P)/FAD-dependent oxidoreductase n=1 Tax=Catenulispora pinisilvae TaxID=2705253 RepID=UPI001891FBE7|nr:FAD-dependent oxidoreductase [Catenulispora pinisilvae]
MSRVVVAGAGLAGHEVVRRLLADPGFDGTITWHAGEPGRPYNRVLLTDLLAGHHAPSAVELPTLTDPRLTYRTTPLRTIAEAEFDHLVLATGAEPLIPPVRGNAVPLRTLADVRTILGELEGAGGAVPANREARANREPLANREADPGRRQVGAVAMGRGLLSGRKHSGGRRIAVVGGGPLGVETACALVSRGVRVELLHRGPHLLSRWLDAESASLLADSLTEAGIVVHCDTDISAATGVWPSADLVILACGTCPRVALARAAGLPLGTGILVDPCGRSIGDDRIFAIGDCAETIGVSSPTGALGAFEGARRAVAAIGGVASTQPAIVAPLRLRTYDIPGADVAVLGTPRAEPSIQFTDQRRRTRKVLALDGDVPVAAALVGDVGAAAALARAIARPSAPAPRVPAALLTSGAGRGAGGVGNA